MTKKTVIIDGVAYCGTLQIHLPLIGMVDATLGACPVDPGTTPPPGRMTRVTCAWRYDLTDKILTDVTQFANVFRGGRNNPPSPFPGQNMYVCVQGWTPGSYLALEFIAPEDTGKTGMFTHGETLPGPNIDACLSLYPGDFESAGPAWRVYNAGPGQIIGRWKQPSVQNNNAPALTPGQKYYLNIRTHDRSVGASVITLQSNHS